MTTPDEPIGCLVPADGPPPGDAARLAAYEAERRRARPKALLRILSSAYEQLDSIGPNLAQLMSAEVANSVAAARRELWSSMERVRKDIEALP